MNAVVFGIFIFFSISFPKLFYDFFLTIDELIFSQQTLKCFTVVAAKVVSRSPNCVQRKLQKTFGKHLILITSSFKEQNLFKLP